MRNIFLSRSLFSFALNTLRSNHLPPKIPPTIISAQRSLRLTISPLDNLPARIISAPSYRHLPSTIPPVVSRLPPTGLVDEEAQATVGAEAPLRLKVKATNQSLHHLVWHCKVKAETIWLRYKEVIRTFHYKEIEKHNVTRLGHWWWGIAVKSNVLWTHIVSNTYFRHKPWQANHTTTSWSAVWKGLYGAKHVFSLGMEACRSRGDNRFWLDRWIPNTRLANHFPLLFALSRSDFLLGNGNIWNFGWRGTIESTELGSF
ncbi:putative inactive ATP-dependent zinc metalloprotease FTSHI 5, chloroplastic [Canna indica]|uniref:Inactive ATP-dependent zinc metalloprotease FTSHI 5, chloroplastic n=1 Tax=Canna indica TaxID=4628 RepID=A0AAQ3KSC0_9LILI|nr:putative inactive ATP-dependent zinc metalloprotease FTSHI 5, chloroplastic [Canna indica]